MVGRFDIDRVSSLAQGAMRVEVVLGQHGLQLLGEIVPSGEELQIVALLRVGHRTTAKKRCSDEGLHAVLALEVLRPDAQGRFLAGVAEKLQQALDLHHILDAELKHRAGGALLAQHIPRMPQRRYSFWAKAATPSFSVCRTMPRSSKYLPKQATA